MYSKRAPNLATPAAPSGAGPYAAQLANSEAFSMPPMAAPSRRRSTRASYAPVSGYAFGGGYASAGYADAAPHEGVFMSCDWPTDAIPPPPGTTSVHATANFESEPLAVLSAQTPPQGILDTLIALQSFDGSFAHLSTLLNRLNVTEVSDVDAVSNSLLRVLGNHMSNDWQLFREVEPKSVLATAFAIAYFETKLSSDRNTWELVVDKARGWLEGKVGSKVMEDLLAAAEKALK